METAEQKPLEDKKQKWKIGFICLSILSIALFATTIILAVRGPIIEYAYGPCPESKDNSSYSDSSSSSVIDTNQHVVAYNPGEKVASLGGVSVEIEQVIKNYQNYDYWYEPEDGHEYIQVKLKFKNNTSNPIHLYTVSFLLEDSNGLADNALFSNRDNSKEYFPFDKDLAGMRETEGVMLFEVKKESTENMVFIYELNSRNKIRIQL